MKNKVEVNTIAAPDALLELNDRYKPITPESGAKTAARIIIAERRCVIRWAVAAWGDEHGD